MADNKSNVGQADRERISIVGDYELGYWAERFGVSQEAVRKAVERVGPIVQDVQKALDES